MADVPMPVDLSEEAVARLLWDAQRPDVDRFAWEQIDRVSKDGWLRMARAVRALVLHEVAKEQALTRAKVREALVLTDHFIPLDYPPLPRASIDAIVARVMGEDAPRG